MPDIVCYYAELGRPYTRLLERMTASARRVMPDARLVLITPTGCDAERCFDVVARIEVKTTFDNLCLERARATVSWMLQTGNRTILADPDIEFRNPVEMDGTFDVGLVWRSGKPDQPINTGLVFAEPGRPQFWKRYGSVAVNLPPTLYGWWCDQLAYVVMTGVAHRAGDRMLIDDARVNLIDSRIACAKPADATEETWAVHYKGALKGEGWESIFPKRSGAGKSLPVSA